MDLNPRRVLAQRRTERDTERDTERRALERRLEALEADVQESRALNLRVAELTDVVMELLVPLADSDDPRVAAIVERYRLAISPDRRGGD
ncbi:DUF6752 domain-containing protein [Nocardioides sp.]|uniref:DUF6752 domain-containing protein n=1 Tax=Nocardioides sp. TaxID=35761 RepID=UPI0027222B90|nr:DUF6752 domain-containing protein [Nocardioides sp.]MDO9457049.1 hypothetical protein [Nocardioides sp.]